MLWFVAVALVLLLGGLLAWRMWPEPAKRSASAAAPAAQVKQVSAQTSTSAPAKSSKSTELAALLAKLVAAKGDYAIAVARPGGPQASTNGDKQYTSASTYKLFVAYAVFTQVDAGRLQWSDVLSPGQTAQTCFEAMIVRSDNDCAKAFGVRIGWDKITTMMHDLGLKNTHVETDHHRTTANDLSLFLTKLQAGELMSTAHRTMLLDAMQRQIYRQGIPAGTGQKVADKPGFLDGLLHDAGIVYSPQGEYVVVILSNNSSWSQLADAARQVDAFMEQP